MNNDKSKLVKQFTTLFKIYKDHARGYSWSIKEVKAYITKLEKLREEVDVLSHEISIDHHDLSIWYYLDFYIDHFNDLLIENENNFWGGSSLKFELTKDELQELDEILKISNFEEEVDYSDENSG